MTLRNNLVERTAQFPELLEDFPRSLLDHIEKGWSAGVSALDTRQWETRDYSRDHLSPLSKSSSHFIKKLRVGLESWPRSEV